MTKAEIEQIIREFHPLVGQTLGMMSDDCFMDFYVMLEVMQNKGKWDEKPTDNEVTKNCKATFRLLLIEYRERYTEIAAIFERARTAAQDNNN